jgi:hypothetical protein
VAIIEKLNVCKSIAQDGRRQTKYKIGDQVIEGWPYYFATSKKI